MQTTNREIRADDFSSNLFWDTSPEEIDLMRHRKYVIRRVLEMGTLDDWKLACKLFSFEGIVETARQLRSLDAKSMAFLCTIGDIKPEDFACYTSKQPRHKERFSRYRILAEKMESFPNVRVLSKKIYRWIFLSGHEEFGLFRRCQRGPYASHAPTDGLEPGTQNDHPCD